MMSVTALMAGCFSFNNIDKENTVKKEPYILKDEDISYLSGRKKTFTKNILPLIVKQNRIIEKENATLKSCVDKKISTTCENLMSKYKIQDLSKDVIDLKVQGVKPSIALTQGAIESGWGTSRFYKQGNAVFGQWTWSGKGIKPSQGKGKHKVKSFDTLQDSVDGYMTNINTNKAYSRFRVARAKNPNNIKGMVNTLDKYSEKGAVYPKLILNVIRQNDFEKFDKI